MNLRRAKGWSVLASEGAGRERGRGDRSGRLRSVTRFDKQALVRDHQQRTRTLSVEKYYL